MDLERIIGTIITEDGPQPFVLHTQSGRLEMGVYAEPDEAQSELSITQQQRFVQLIAERADVPFARVRLGQYFDGKSDQWVDVLQEGWPGFVSLAPAPVAKPQPEAQTPTETVEDAPAEAEEPPAETVEETATETVEQTPAETVEEAPEEVVEEAPAEVADEAPVEAVDEAPAEAADEVPAEIMEEAPVEGVDEMPVEIIEEAPAETVEEKPVEIIEEEPVLMFEGAMADTIEEKPAEIIGDVPAEPVDEMPVEIIGDTPVEAVEEMPVEIIEDTPVEAVEEAPPESFEEETPPAFFEKEAPPVFFEEETPAFFEEEAPVVIDAVLLPDAEAMLEKAIRIAVEAHGGQFDKAGAPYILHPLRMMFQMTSSIERVAAVLHDIVEDTGWTLDALRREGFSEAVVEAVDSLTRRPDETYEAFIERAAQHPVARRVKLADLEDNMDVRRLHTLTEKDQARLARYQKAWQRLKDFGF